MSPSLNDDDDDDGGGGGGGGGGGDDDDDDDYHGWKQSVGKNGEMRNKSVKKKIIIPVMQVTSSTVFLFKDIDEFVNQNSGSCKDA